MIASLLLPAWSLNDSVDKASINIMPYGAHYGSSSTNEFKSVIDMSGGGQFAVAALLVMTIFTIIILFIELLFTGKDDGIKKHRRIDNPLIASAIFTILTPSSVR